MALRQALALGPQVRRGAFGHDSTALDGLAHRALGAAYRGIYASPSHPEQALPGHCPLGEAAAASSAHVLQHR